MPVDRDSVGERGESIVTTLLTRRHGQPDARFRPRFLGEKYPMIDFFVELVGAGGMQTPFFFIQVKATSMGYNARGKLKVQVTEPKMLGLVKYPVPTYVVGVDEVNERAFIVAALAGGAPEFSSLPVDYPLMEEQTLIDLYEGARRNRRGQAARS
jgi:hypothetical protein